jgi:hypothetical protein
MGLTILRLFICLLLVGFVGCGETQRVTNGAWRATISEEGTEVSIFLELNDNTGRFSFRGMTGDANVRAHDYFQIADLVFVNNKLTFLVLMSGERDKDSIQCELVYKEGKLVGSMHESREISPVIRVSFTKIDTELIPPRGLGSIGQSRLRHDAQFVLRAEDMQLLPEQPSWIRENVLQSVVKQHNLEELFLDDSNFYRQLSDAFMLHSWILSVDSVVKSPTGVEVRVNYRKPVAMVEVRYDDRPHVLPIDAGGTVLPPGDFKVDDISNYLRIAADHVRPSGNVGDPWGDAKVEGAAKLAGLFARIAWKEMGLYRIEVTMNSRDSTAVYYIVMKENPGIRVLWGSEPGQ